MTNIDLVALDTEVYGYLQNYLDDIQLYLRRAPSGCTYPCCTMVAVSVTPYQLDLGGHGGLQVNLQIDCYALDDRTADLTAERVIEALHRPSEQGFKLGEVCFCLSGSFDSLTDNGELIDPDLGGEQMIIRKTLTFLLHIEQHINK